MALDFPSSPTLNQIYTSGNNAWIWNGYAWDAVNTMDRIRRSASSSNYIYIGTAPRMLGSVLTTDSDAVWIIWRLLISASGSVTEELSATNVNWTNYLTHTYS